MSLFSDSEVFKYISHIESSEEELNNLLEWLQKPPSFTTFRINKLKPGFSLEPLKSLLEEQRQSLHCNILPKCESIRPDCLLVGQWPSDWTFPEVCDDIIVDAGCGAAVLRGSHVFAPGVMAMSPAVQIDQLVNIYADVNGKCKKGLKVPFEECKRFVGVGRVKMNRTCLFRDSVLPSGTAIEVLMPASRLPVINETCTDPGSMLLQNLPSIVCGWVVDPKPGELILDMCAAPGNKTTHLAELSNDEAIITALDKTESKVSKIKENCLKHNINSVKSYVQDSTKCCSDDKKNTIVGPPFPENYFDKILLDAPCSALGQRPQIKNKITAKMLDSYKFLQRKLFVNAVRLLKPGGHLVYSTCTISKEENECMVAWALNKFTEVELVETSPVLGGPGWPNCGLDDPQRLLVQRFGPEDDSLRKVDAIYRDTVGFFLAKFKKIK